MTELKLVLVPKQDSKQNQDSLDEYVGVVEGLVSPFSIFVKVGDLGRYSIRFISYAAGKQRILLWGTYFPKDNQAEVKNSCKYGTPGAKLSAIVNNVEYRGFQYTGGATKNRIAATMASMNGGQDVTQFPEKYRIYKYYLSDLEGKIKKKDLDLKMQDEIDDEFQKFVALQKDWDQKRIVSEGTKKLEQEFETYVRDFVREYESKVNLLDYNTSIKETKIITQLVSKITDLVKFGHFYKDAVYSALETCPTESTCEILGQGQNKDQDPLCDMWEFGSDDDLDTLV